MILDRDVLFHINPLQYGAITRRVAPIARGGEEQKETLVRSSGSVFTRRDGSLGYAGNDVPRITRLDLDADGIFETPALSVEGERTNGWDKSEELEHANWIKAGVTALVNNTTAPDGTVTAEYIQESALNEGHRVSRGTPALTDNTRSTITVFVRPSTGGRWLRIATTNKANVSRSTWFNPATGAVGTTDAGHVTFVERSALVSGADYYRLGVSFDAASGATAPSVDLQVATGDGIGSYQGDGASGLMMWGVQFEADKSFPSSYIRTTTAAATRSADVASVPYFAPPQAMALYLKLVERSVMTVRTDVLTIGTGPRLLLYKDGGGNAYRINLHNGSSGVETGTTPTPTLGNIVELRSMMTVAASGWAANLGQSLNGGAESLTGLTGNLAAATVWTPNEIHVGHDNALFHAFSPIIAVIGVRAPGNVFPSMDEFRAQLPPVGWPYS